MTKTTSLQEFLNHKLIEKAALGRRSKKTVKQYQRLYKKAAIIPMPIALIKEDSIQPAINKKGTGI